MPILTIILVLVVVGFVMWVINAYIPMAGAIKTLLNLVVLIVLIIWLLQVFGLIGPIQEAFHQAFGNLKVKG